MEIDGAATDTITLRFVGENEDGSELHELRASHVAEVLEGLVGIASDFEKAGAFGDGLPAEVLVRPAREGSFIIEVVRILSEHADEIATGAGVAGVPSLSSIIWWATRSARADVKDFDYLENGNVKVVWQDDTAEEIPRPAWAELNKRSRRRKKHLRQIMAPLSDDRVTAVKVKDEDPEPEAEPSAPVEYTLERTDYHLMRPEDDIEEKTRVFEAEAEMAAIDFEDNDRWRVRTADTRRMATMEDAAFLLRVERGLALHKDDVFNLRIREDYVKKNGTSRTTWTVLEVLGHRRRSVNDDDA